MKFEQYKIEDLKKAVTALIKKHKTIASATQEMLMGIAYVLETDNAVLELNRFVVQLSDTDDDGKVILSSTARAVGVYMQAMLPVKWSKKDQGFNVTDEILDFDFDVACEAMEATRWDKYGVKSADSEFDADNLLKKAMGMINTIIKHHDDGGLQDDDPAFQKARRIAKAF